MPQSPRILVVGAETGPAGDITATLEKRGIRSRFATGAGALQVSIADSPPDIVIVDGRAGPKDLSEVLQAAKENGSGAQVPIIVIGAGNGLTDDTLSRVDNVLSKDFHEIELLSRLDSLTRLNTMQDELVRRCETDRLYGFQDDGGLDAEIDMSALRIVLVSPDPAVDTGIKALLGETADLVVYSQGFVALSALNDARYDCAIIDGGAESLDAVELCAEIRSNPRLFHLPVIVLSGDTDEAVDIYFARGASDVVTGDWRSGDFKNRIRTHAKLQRMRSKMLEAYGRAMPLVTSDSLTGLYSHGYLHTHLANQIKDAEHKGHDLSVGFFRVSELRDINETFGYPAGDKVLRQIGTILSRIVRGEDLPARYAGNEFCIVFPDTPAETAQRIVLRIKSVIETTELAVSDMDRAVNVLIHAAAESLDHGRDTAKALIGRARKAAKS